MTLLELYIVHVSVCRLLMDVHAYVYTVLCTCTRIMYYGAHVNLLHVTIPFGSFS